MKYKNYLKAIPIVALALSVFSAAMILYFILKYGVDVPYNDQWNYAEFFVHLKNGTLTFEELFRLQNEYRQFFPNLIFVGLGWLTKWDVRYEMIVVFLLACLTSFNIYRLIFITLKSERWIKWVLFFLANLFIFSPMQYENWLFGVQIQYLLPMACISSCMLIVFTNTKSYLKFLYCMILAMISTYSTPNGFLCWIVLLPILLLCGKDRRFFSKWYVIALWLIGIGITLFFYFYDYRNPPSYPSTFAIFEHPVDAVRYFFALLGNPIRIVHSLNHIMVVGGVMFSIFAILVLYIVYHYKDIELIRSSVVWLMLGMYSTLTAVLVTIGRLGFGLYQSLSSRYTSFTLFLVIATLFLLVIVTRHFSDRKKYLSKVIYAVVALLTIIIVYIKIDTYSVAVDDLKTFHARIQHGKAGLLFINHFYHRDCENKIYPYNPEQLKCWANLLNDLGYLRPSLIKTNVLQDIEGEGSGTIAYGSLNKLERLQGTVFKAQGTTIMPTTKGPADAIILTFENIEGKSLLLDIYNADSINWTKTFSLDIVPFNQIIISAWAFDANTAKAYKLHGSYNVDKIEH